MGVIRIHMEDSAVRARHDGRHYVFWQEHLIGFHGLDPAETCHGMDFLGDEAPEGEIRKVEIG